MGKLAIIFLFWNRMACSGMRYSNVRCNWRSDDEKWPFSFDSVLDITQSMIGNDISAVAMNFLWLIMLVTLVVLKC